MFPVAMEKQEIDLLDLRMDFPTQEELSAKPVSLESPKAGAYEYTPSTDRCSANRYARSTHRYGGSYSDRRTH